MAGPKINLAAGQKALAKLKRAIASWKPAPDNDERLGLLEVLSAAVDDVTRWGELAEEALGAEIGLKEDEIFSIELHTDERVPDALYEKLSALRDLHEVGHDVGNDLDEAVDYFNPHNRRYHADLVASAKSTAEAMRDALTAFSKNLRKKAGRSEPNPDKVATLIRKLEEGRAKGLQVIGEIREAIGSEDWSKVEDLSARLKETGDALYDGDVDPFLVLEYDKPQEEIDAQFPDLIDVLRTIWEAAHDAEGYAYFLLAFESGDEDPLRSTPADLRSDRDDLELSVDRMENTIGLHLQRAIDAMRARFGLGTARKADLSPQHASYTEAFSQIESFLAPFRAGRVLDVDDAMSMRAYDLLSRFQGAVNYFERAGYDPQSAATEGIRRVLFQIGRSVFDASGVLIPKELPTWLSTVHAAFREIERVAAQPKGALFLEIADRLKAIAQGLRKTANEVRAAHRDHDNAKLTELANSLKEYSGPTSEGEITKIENAIGTGDEKFMLEGYTQAAQDVWQAAHSVQNMVHIRTAGTYGYRDEDVERAVGTLSDAAVELGNVATNLAAQLREEAGSGDDVAKAKPTSRVARRLRDFLAWLKEHERKLIDRDGDPEALANQLKARGAEVGAIASVIADDPGVASAGKVDEEFKRAASDAITALRYMWYDAHNFEDSIQEGDSQEQQDDAESELLGAIEDVRQTLSDLADLLEGRKGARKAKRPMTVREAGERVIRELACSPQQINDGMCPDWAEKVQAIVGGQTRTTPIEGDPEPGYEEESTVDGLPVHAWLYLNGRHYDAETLDGVEDWRDLPIFQRALKRRTPRKKASGSPKAFLSRARSVQEDIEAMAENVRTGAWEDADAYIVELKIDVEELTAMVGIQPWVTDEVVTWTHGLWDDVHQIEDYVGDMSEGEFDVEGATEDDIVPAAQRLASRLETGIRHLIEAVEDTRRGAGNTQRKSAYGDTRTVEALEKARAIVDALRAQLERYRGGDRATTEEEVASARGLLDKSGVLRAWLYGIGEVPLADEAVPPIQRVIQDRSMRFIALSRDDWTASYAGLKKLTVALNRMETELNTSPDQTLVSLAGLMGQLAARMSRKAEAIRTWTERESRRVRRLAEDSKEYAGPVSESYLYQIESRLDAHKHKLPPDTWRAIQNSVVSYTNAARGVWEQAHIVQNQFEQLYEVFPAHDAQMLADLLSETATRAIDLKAVLLDAARSGGVKKLEAPYGHIDDELAQKRIHAAIAEKFSQWAEDLGWMEKDLDRAEIEIQQIRSAAKRRDAIGQLEMKLESHIGSIAFGLAWVTEYEQLLDRGAVDLLDRITSIMQEAWRVKHDLRGEIYARVDPAPMDDPVNVLEGSGVIQSIRTAIELIPELVAEQRRLAGMPGVSEEMEKGESLDPEYLREIASSLSSLASKLKGMPKELSEAEGDELVELADQLKEDGVVALGIPWDLTSLFDSGDTVDVSADLMGWMRYLWQDAHRVQNLVDDPDEGDLLDSVDQAVADLIDDVKAVRRAAMDLAEAIEREMATQPRSDATEKAGANEPNLTPEFVRESLAALKQFCEHPPKPGSRKEARDWLESASIPLYEVGAWLRDLLFAVGDRPISDQALELLSVGWREAHGLDEDLSDLPKNTSVAELRNYVDFFVSTYEHLSSIVEKVLAAEDLKAILGKDGLEKAWFGADFEVPRNEEVLAALKEADRIFQAFTLKRIPKARRAALVVEAAKPIWTLERVKGSSVFLGSDIPAVVKSDFVMLLGHLRDLVTLGAVHDLDVKDYATYGRKAVKIVLDYLNALPVASVQTAAKMASSLEKLAVEIERIGEEADSAASTPVDQADEWALALEELANKAKEYGGIQIAAKLQGLEVAVQHLKWRSTEDEAFASGSAEGVTNLAQKLWGTAHDLQNRAYEYSQEDESVARVRQSAAEFVSNCEDMARLLRHLAGVLKSARTVKKAKFPKFTREKLLRHQATVQRAAELIASLEAGKALSRRESDVIRAALSRLSRDVSASIYEPELGRAVAVLEDTFSDAAGVYLLPSGERPFIDAAYDFTLPKRALEWLSGWFLDALTTFGGRPTLEKLSAMDRSLGEIQRTLSRTRLPGKVKLINLANSMKEYGSIVGGALIAQLEAAQPEQTEAMQRLLQTLVGDARRLWQTAHVIENTADYGEDAISLSDAVENAVDSIVILRGTMQDLATALRGVKKDDPPEVSDAEVEEELKQLAWMIDHAPSEKASEADIVKWLTDAGGGPLYAIGVWLRDLAYSDLSDSDAFNLGKEGWEIAHGLDWAIYSALNDPEAEDQKLPDPAEIRMMVTNVIESYPRLTKIVADVKRTRVVDMQKVIPKRRLAALERLGKEALAVFQKVRVSPNRSKAKRAEAGRLRKELEPFRTWIWEGNTGFSDHAIAGVIYSLSQIEEWGPAVSSQGFFGSAISDTKDLIGEAHAAGMPDRVRSEGLPVLIRELQAMVAELGDAEDRLEAAYEEGDHDNAEDAANDLKEYSSLHLGVIEAALRNVKVPPSVEDGTTRLADAIGGLWRSAHMAQNYIEETRPDDATDWKNEQVMELSISVRDVIRIATEVASLVSRIGPPRAKAGGTLTSARYMEIANLLEARAESMRHAADSLRIELERMSWRYIQLAANRVKEDSAFVTGRIVESLENAAGRRTKQLVHDYLVAIDNVWDSAHQVQNAASFKEIGNTKKSARFLIRALSDAAAITAKLRAEAFRMAEVTRQTPPRAKADMRPLDTAGLRELLARVKTIVANRGASHDEANSLYISLLGFRRVLSERGNFRAEGDLWTIADAIGMATRTDGIPPGGLITAERAFERMGKFLDDIEQIGASLEEAGTLVIQIRDAIHRLGVARDLLGQGFTNRDWPLIVQTANSMKEYGGTITGEVSFAIEAAATRETKEVASALARVSGKASVVWSRAHLVQNAVDAMGDRPSEVTTRETLGYVDALRDAAKELSHELETLAVLIEASGGEGVAKGAVGVPTFRRLVDDLEKIAAMPYGEERKATRSTYKDPLDHLIWFLNDTGFTDEGESAEFLETVFWTRNFETPREDIADAIAAIRGALDELQRMADLTPEGALTEAAAALEGAIAYMQNVVEALIDAGDASTLEGIANDLKEGGDVVPASVAGRIEAMLHSKPELNRPEITLLLDGFMFAQRSLWAQAHVLQNTATEEIEAADGEDDVDRYTELTNEMTAGMLRASRNWLRHATELARALRSITRKAEADDSVGVSLPELAAALLSKVEELERSASSEDWVRGQNVAEDMKDLVGPQSAELTAKMEAIGFRGIEQKGAEGLLSSLDTIQGKVWEECHAIENAFSDLMDLPDRERGSSFENRLIEIVWSSLAQLSRLAKDYGAKVSRLLKAQDGGHATGKALANMRPDSFIKITRGSTGNAFVYLATVKRVGVKDETIFHRGYQDPARLRAMLADVYGVPGPVASAALLLASVGAVFIVRLTDGWSVGRADGSHEFAFDDAGGRAKNGGTEKGGPEVEDFLAAISRARRYLEEIPGTGMPPDGIAHEIATSLRAAWKTFSYRSSVDTMDDITLQKMNDDIDRVVGVLEHPGIAARFVVEALAATKRLMDFVEAADTGEAFFEGGEALINGLLRDADVLEGLAGEARRYLKEDPAFDDADVSLPNIEQLEQAANTAKEYGGVRMGGYLVALEGIDGSPELAAAVARLANTMEFLWEAAHNLQNKATYALEDDSMDEGDLAAEARKDVADAASEFSVAVDHAVAAIQAVVELLREERTTGEATKGLRKQPAAAIGLESIAASLRSVADKLEGLDVKTQAHRLETLANRVKEYGAIQLENRIYRLEESLRELSLKVDEAGAEEESEVLDQGIQRLANLAQGLWYEAHELQNKAFTFQNGAPIDWEEVDVARDNLAEECRNTADAADDLAQRVRRLRAEIGKRVAAEGYVFDPADRNQPNSVLFGVSGTPFGGETGTETEARRWLTDNLGVPDGVAYEAVAAARSTKRRVVFVVRDDTPKGGKWWVEGARPAPAKKAEHFPPIEVLHAPTDLAEPGRPYSIRSITSPWFIDEMLRLLGKRPVSTGGWPFVICSAIELRFVLKKIGVPSQAVEDILRKLQSCTGCAVGVFNRGDVIQTYDADGGVREYPSTGSANKADTDDPWKWVVSLKLESAGRWRTWGAEAEKDPKTGLLHTVEWGNRLLALHEITRRGVPRNIAFRVLEMATLDQAWGVYVSRGPSGWRIQPSFGVAEDFDEDGRPTSVHPDKWRSGGRKATLERKVKAVLWRDGSEWRIASSLPIPEGTRNPSSGKPIGRWPEGNWSTGGNRLWAIHVLRELLSIPREVVDAAVEVAAGQVSVSISSTERGWRVYGPGVRMQLFGWDGEVEKTAETDDVSRKTDATIVSRVWRNPGDESFVVDDGGYGRYSAIGPSEAEAGSNGMTVVGEGLSMGPRLGATLLLERFYRIPRPVAMKAVEIAARTREVVRIMRSPTLPGWRLVWLGGRPPYDPLVLDDTGREMVGREKEESPNRKAETVPSGHVAFVTARREVPTGHIGQGSQRLNFMVFVGMADEPVVQGNRLVALQGLRDRGIPLAVALRAVDLAATYLPVVGNPWIEVRRVADGSWRIVAVGLWEHFDRDGAFIPEPDQDQRQKGLDRTVQGEARSPSLGCLDTEGKAA